MGQVFLKPSSDNKKVEDPLSLARGQIFPKPSSDNNKVDGCGMERRPWSNLPDLALHAIAMKLSSPFALCVFAGVCRSWRSVAKSHKSDFIASQPPLLLLLPDIRPPSKKRQKIPLPTSSSSSYFRFYSVIENQIYKIARDQFSPVLASLVSSKDLFIVGHSYGYLIASASTDKSTPLCDHIPILVSLRTGEKISFPRCHFVPQRGMLTSPPDARSSMLILYTVCIFFVLVYCCRLGDASGHVYVFNLPRASWVARSIRSTIVHGGKLYISILGGKVLVADTNGIQAAAVANILSVARDRGIIMISPNGSQLEVRTHNTLIDNGRLRGGWEGRMMDNWYIPCTSTYCLFWIDAEVEGSLIDNAQSLFCAGGDGLWVHPHDLHLLGFKNL